VLIGVALLIYVADQLSKALVVANIGLAPARQGGR